MLPRGHDPLADDGVTASVDSSRSFGLWENTVVYRRLVSTQETSRWLVTRDDRK